MPFTENELNAIRFYQGDTESISDINERELEEFYNVKQAYNVLNVLLFPDIKNEIARYSEGKILDTILVQHMPELLNIYCDLYSAMCKYTFRYEKRKTLLTKRADRKASLCAYSQGKNFSFLSTTSKRNVDEYFCKKAELVLLDIEAEGNAEHINLNEVLGNTLYSIEEEILYAPFLNVAMKEVKLDDSEKLLKDYNGQPPIGKYKLIITSSNTISGKIRKNALENKSEEKIYREIIDKKEISNVIEVWRSLEKGEELEDSREIQYIKWKEKVQEYLRRRFEAIKSKYLDNVVEMRLDMLRQDISEYKKWTNEKRIEYDKTMIMFNIMLSIMQPLVAVAMALSFMESIEVIAKIAGIILSGVCMILYRMNDALGIKGKLEQRTSTYLKLDELEREIRYEEFITEKKLCEFIEYFKAIISEDDKKSENNLRKMVSDFEKIGTKLSVKGGDKDE